MDSLRKHTITFTFSPNIKSSIINWIKLVQAFSLSFVESGTTDNDLTKSHNDAPQIFHVEEVLETTVVQLATVLVSKLGHPVSNLRTKSATYLTKLAAILDEKFICNDPKTDNAINLFVADNYGNFCSLI